MKQTLAIIFNLIAITATVQGQDRPVTQDYGNFSLHTYYA